MQEFLASFAVDIDEAGVSRLQKILRDNRDLAGQVTVAFDTARKAMEDLFSFSPEEWGSLSLPTSLPELPETSARLSLEPDFTRAGRSLSAFLSEAKKQMRLTADASGIISAAMLTAISSGVTAPMARPMGVWTFASCSSEMPASRNFALTAAVFFLDPMTPI